MRTKDSSVDTPFRDTGAAGDFRAREQLREPLGLQLLAQNGANFCLSG
jgi:hypothetical protein